VPVNEIQSGDGDERILERSGLFKAVIPMKAAIIYYE
jgi:hypothetical protein